MLPFSGCVNKIIIIKKWLISNQIQYPRFRMQQNISVFSHEYLVKLDSHDSKTNPDLWIWWRAVNFWNGRRYLMDELLNQEIICSLYPPGRVLCHSNTKQVRQSTLSKGYFTTLCSIQRAKLLLYYKQLTC